jgi:hypothetical protein
MVSPSPAGFDAAAVVVGATAVVLVLAAPVFAAVVETVLFEVHPASSKPDAATAAPSAIAREVRIEKPPRINESTGA